MFFSFDITALSRIISSLLYKYVLYFPHRSLVINVTVPLVPFQLERNCHFKYGLAVGYSFIQSANMAAPIASRYTTFVIYVSGFLVS